VRGRREGEEKATAELASDRDTYHASDLLENRSKAAASGAIHLQNAEKQEG
jgi:hypothetical protein